MPSRRSFKQKAARDPRRRAIAKQQEQLARALLENKGAPPGFDSAAFQSAAESLQRKKQREAAPCSHHGSPGEGVAGLQEIFGLRKKSRWQRLQDLFSSLLFKGGSSH